MRRVNCVLSAAAMAIAAIALAAPAPEVAAQRPKRQTDKKLATDFELECLAAHNKWRRMHQAPDLELDAKITTFAQKRADFIAASDGDEFKHPDDLAYGENLAWHSRESKSCADLVKMWYDEIELYDFNEAKFSHETGHFTQLVWRSTSRVGCARAISTGAKGGVYLVCNYDPPGNFLGEAKDNVFPVATVARGKPTLAPSASTPPSATTATSAVKPDALGPSGDKKNSNKTTTTTTTKPKKKKSNKKKKNKNKNTNKAKAKKNGNKAKRKKGKKSSNKEKKLQTSTSATIVSLPVAQNNRTSTI